MYRDPIKRRLYARKWKASHKENVNRSARINRANRLLKDAVSVRRKDRLRQDIYRHKHPIKVKRTAKRWNENHPGVNADRAREYAWVQRGVLNLNGSQFKLANYYCVLETQEGKCAICGATEKLGIDHDHQTGYWRGILCSACNARVGAWESKRTSAKLKARWGENIILYLDNYMKRRLA